MPSGPHDLSLAVRRLRREPGFALTALATLALTIGATTAIFAVVNAVLLRPLPFAESHRVVEIYNSYPNAGAGKGDSSVPNFFDRQGTLPALSDLAMYKSRGMTLGGQGSAERVPGFQVTTSFFDLIRTPAYRGRLFLPEDGEVGNNQKAILSHALWQRLFAGRENALGQDVRVNGLPMTVIGVMPPDFQFVEADVALWTPAAFTPEDRADDRRHSNSWTMIGRLRPGASVLQAQEQLDALNARLLDQFPDMKPLLIDAGFRTFVAPLHEELVREVQPVLTLLLGGVLAVLLIGCINLTSLVLVRSQGQLKEFATRRSLGATPGRIVRQGVLETTLLTLCGGALGLLLAKVAIDSMTRFGLAALPRGSEVRLDGTVIVVMLTLAIALGCAIGAVPLVGLWRMSLPAALREESRGGTSGRSARRARRLLVVAQVAFAFTLLVAAGVLAVSFRRVLQVDPGFEPRGVESARLSLPAARYPDDAALVGFSERLLEGVRRSPGVRSVGLTTSIPFGGSYSDSVILPEGYQAKAGESLVSPSQLAVSDGYLEALEARLTAGRFFAPTDTARTLRVAIVDERLAQRFWPDQNPLGRRMFFLDGASVVPGPDTVFITVVGVISEVKMRGLVDTSGRVGAYYFPYSQAPENSFAIALRTDGDPHAALADLRRQVVAIDPELPVYDVRLLDERLDEALLGRRVPLLLALVFAGVALLLAGVGIYGVLAYQVGQRTREIGIRMALGSTARAISVLVVREGLWMVGLGLGLGLLGALLSGRAMENLLFRVEPLDGRVIVAVALLLAAVALAAALGPARRARRVDPATALND